MLAQVEEVDNEVNCIDYSPTKNLIASGGKDTNVRLYDPNKLKHECTVLSESSFVPQHSNRVYSVKFLEENSNLLISGGWDHTILFWDIRVKNPVEYIYGPAIFGDSLDFHSNMVLAGSWRNENQIELYDIRNYKKISSYNWVAEEGQENSPYIYACKFANNGNDIVAGSTGINEIRVFDYQNDFKCKYLKKNFPSGIFCVENLEYDNNFLVCGNDGLAVHIEPKLL